jgi:hypothetical protein
MKQLFIISIVTILLISCGQKQRNYNSEKSGSIKIDTVENTIAEKKLKTQLREYLIALSAEEIDIALSYLYGLPDILEYMKLNFPDEHIDEEVVRNIIFSQIRELNKLVKEKKLSYEFEIGDIIKEVKYEKNHLYIVMLYLNVKEKLDKHSIGSKIISISNDNGQNWNFFTYDPYDPETFMIVTSVLKMRFPQDIVDKLFSKE